MAMLDRESLEAIGFASIGENISISDRATFYGAENISLQSNIRIDDFCVLAAGVGGIKIGNYVHIGVGCSLIGAGKISLSDFSGLSSRVAVYSSSDDYSGAFLTNPTVPRNYTNVTHADVFLGKHVIVGSGAVILPGVTIEDGTAIGALSLIQKNCASFGIYTGNPAKRIKDRKMDLLGIERKMKEDLKI